MYQRTLPLAFLVVAAGAVRADRHLDGRSCDGGTVVAGQVCSNGEWKPV